MQQVCSKKVAAYYTSHSQRRFSSFGALNPPVGALNRRVGGLNSPVEPLDSETTDKESLKASQSAYNSK